MKITSMIRLSLLLIILSGVAFAPSASAQDGGWSTVAPFTLPRRDVSGVALNGLVYAIGGHDNGCGDYSDVDVYDRTTNTWTARASMLNALNAPVVGVIDGKIYISTGGTACGASSADTEVYDPTNNSWTTKAPNPQARGGAGGGVMNGKLYVVAGDPGNGLVSRMDAYDPVTDTWTARAPIPTPRSQFGSAIVNEILYVIAGGTTLDLAQDPGGLTKVVEAYDPVSNRWTTKAPLPEFVYWSPGMATVLNGRIYVCGGAKNIGSISYDGATPSNAVYVYDPASDTWTRITSMPIPRAIGTAVGNAGKVYVFAGLNSFTPDTLTSEVDVFTPTESPGTTSVGSHVTANLELPGTGTVAVTFSQVTTAGNTTVTQIDPASAGMLPLGFEPASPSVAFDISTTASYSAPITIAFQLPNLDAVTFAQLRVFHRQACTDTGADCVNGFRLEDVTASTPAPDPATQTIYAQVNSLSPFVVATRVYHATIHPPINADGSSIFTVKRGVVPVKFALSLAGVQICGLPPATIALWRTAGGNVGTVNEPMYTTVADQGSLFRIDSCQYVYNLNSSALGLGTYRVDIKISDRVVGSGVFQLK